MENNWQDEFLKVEKTLITIEADGLDIIDGEPKVHVSVNTDKLVDYISTKKSEWEKASFERGKIEGVKEVLGMMEQFKNDKTRPDNAAWYRLEELAAEITKKFNL